MSVGWGSPSRVQLYYTKAEYYFFEKKSSSDMFTRYASYYYLGRLFTKFQNNKNLSLKYYAIANQIYQQGVEQFLTINTLFFEVMKRKVLKKSKQFELSFTIDQKLSSSTNALEDPSIDQKESPMKTSKGEPINGDNHYL